MTPTRNRPVKFRAPCKALAQDTGSDRGSAVVTWMVSTIAVIIIGVSGCGRDESPGASQDALSPIRQMISSGKMDDADLAIQQHLIGHPDDPQGLFLAAQTSFALGRVDRAVGLLDAAAEAWPENARDMKARAADLLAQSSRWQESISRFEELIAEHPDFDNARHMLARLLNARGFRFDANQHVRHLCRSGSATAEELRGLISPSRTFVTFAEKPSIEMPQEVEKSGPLSVALALFGEGDVRDALTVLERSELIKDKNPCALAFYGQVLLESQQFDEFSDWLDQAPAGCQRYPAYWMALGGWALHQQQYEIAVRMFAEAVLREPGDESANSRLTQALRAAGQTEAANRFLKRSEQINQLTQVTKIVLSDPRAGAEAVSELSGLLAKMGRPAEALAWHRLALQSINAPPQAMQQLATEQRKVVQAERENPEYLRRILLCGLNLNEFPLDPSRLARGRSTPDTLLSEPAHIHVPPALPPSFVNVAAEVGLEFQYRNAPLPVEREFRIFQSYGAGVACLDFDLDGRVDFYIGQASGEPPDGQGTMPNQLSRNLGTHFHDVTDAARCDDRRYTCGVTAGDWNQDGFPDLVIGNMQQNMLLINQGDGSFRPQAGDNVWNDARYTTNLAMADVNGDHLPDIIEINYLQDPRIYDPIEYKPDGTPVRLPGPLHFKPAADRLFLSRGDGSLDGRPLGSPGTLPATGLGLLVTDIDNKVGNEIFVANDLMANQLWQRSGDGDTVAWSDVAVVRGVAYGSKGMPMACMGIAAADFDQNGWLDLHITNFADQWSNQYMQRESGVFVDLTLPLGLDRDSLKTLGFGVQAIDYDNNSTIDLVVGNGHVEDNTARGTAFEMPTQIFAWQAGRFELMEVLGDPDYWNAGHLSRALAYCDWNNDGRVDFIVTDLKQPLALLENRTETSYHWLQLELVGTTAERDAIGTTVQVTSGGQTITKVIQSGDGYMCRNQPFVAFGLANAPAVERIEIRWPDGEQQTLTGLAADERWLVIQGDDTPIARKDR